MSEQGRSASQKLTKSLAPNPEDWFGSLGNGDNDQDDLFDQLGNDEDDEQAPGVIRDDVGLDEADPFAGVGEDEDEDLSQASGEVQEHKQEQEKQPTLEVANEEDPFAGIAEEQQEDAFNTGELRYSLDEAASNHTEVTDIPLGKDYSDLLAEFEDDSLLPIDSSPVTQTADSTSETPHIHLIDATPQVVQNAQTPDTAQALLFDGDDSAFDDFLGGSGDTSSRPLSANHTPPELESPAPELSIEMTPPASERMEDHPGDVSVQSLFSETSDWLGDTTMEDSFSAYHGAQDAEGEVYLGNDRDSAGLGDAKDESRGSRVTDEDVDVPEGWIDEYGEFHYYTPEEKEAVRASLVAEKMHTGEQEQDYQSTTDAEWTSPSFPSENAARRTPQPDHPSRIPSPPHIQSAYAPPPFSRHSSGLPAKPSVSTPSTVLTPALVDPYAAPSPTSSTHSPYAPTPSGSSFASPYDPYAPAPQAYPSAPASRSFQPPTTSPSKAGSSKPVRPKEPERVVSNAYDPPFLRPQKSFIRPTSANTFSPPIAFTPPVPVPSLTPAVQPSAHVAPPSGPPRRTPSVPPLPPQPFSRPVPPAQPIAETSAYQPESSRRSLDQYSQHEQYAPPSKSQPPLVPPNRPISQSSQRNPPPRAPSVPNAFDPPLRPSSAARSVSRPNFSPQPPSSQPLHMLSPPAAAMPLPPSRPGSTGPPRRATPSFEPPPVNQRNAVVSPPSHPLESANYGRPPSRQAVPPQREVAEQRQVSGVPRDAGWPHLTGEEHEAEVEDQETKEAVDQSCKGGYTSRSMEEDFEEEQDDSNEWRTSNQSNLSARPAIEAEDEEDLYSSHKDTGVSRFSGPPDFAAPPTRDDDLYARQIQQPAPPPAQPSYDPYAPSTSSSQYDSYAPRSQSGPPALVQPPRSLTPPVEARSAIRSSPSKARPALPAAFVEPARDPYAPYAAGPSAYQPISTPAFPPATGDRPNQSTFGVQPSSSYLPNPYAPGPAQSTGLSDPYGPQRTISPAQGSDQAGSSYQDNNYFQSMPLDTSYVPQQVLEQRPLSEDPLGRCTVSAKNIPLAVFGFGGVLVTAFPGNAEDVSALGHNRTPSYGYASGRGQIHIRPLSSVLELSSFKSDAGAENFPGPLILDPTAPKGSAGEKKKKEAVLMYLDSRADEIERGLPYLKSSASGAAARREEEGKLLLVRLLSALVIGEGKFGGSPKVDEAMRKALANPSPGQPLLSPTSTHFNTSLYPSSTISSSNRSNPTATSASSSQLSSLSDLLVGGDKRDAVEFAARHGLWSHALVIASSLGPEVWKEAVGRFAKEELGGEGVAGLKASYALFAGSDPATVEELYTAANISEDPGKDHWREVIASIVFNGRPTDLAYLDELGGKFMQRGLQNAAYACFLLSPSSPFIDHSPAAFDRPLAMAQDTRNEDAIIFAEIAEYARGMIAVPKGQEVPFPGLPILLPSKLQRAWQAAEQGDVELAKRYCNAVEAASKMVKAGPVLLSPHHLSSLEDLLERLTGSPSIEPAKGLSARKQPTKPGLDKIGSWIEGRLTKFIAGEDDSSTTTAAPTKPAQTTKGAAPVTGGVVGPFSHFSTISPAQSSDVSRNGSVQDFNAGTGMLGVPDGRRSGMPSPQNEFPPPMVNVNAGYSGGSDWRSNTGDTTEVGEESEDTTPMADDVGELINPMAAMSFGGPSFSAANTGSQANYAPKKANQEEDEDEDDLGFGNAGLSRGKTPRPGGEDPASPAESSKATAGTTAAKAAESTSKTDTSADGKDSPSQDAKAAAAAGGGWFKGWWGKKEGDGSMSGSGSGSSSGPVRAKLGDENAMVFDKELRRWVVKGQKPEAAAAAPPPPPRAQTASPSKSSRAPPSASNAPPPGVGSGQYATVPRSVSSSASFNGPPTANSTDDMPPVGPRRTPAPPRSGLSESVTAAQALPAAAALSTPAAGMGAKPMLQGNGPPPLPPLPPGQGRPTPPSSRPGSNAPSIDDLLSRPPSKRPASAAAKKGARNRYVDVFQQPGAGGES